MRPLAVLVVECSPLFRTALTSILSKDRATVTPGESPRPGKKRAKAYDAVLIDIATFPGTDEDLAKLIRSHSELGPVLLLSREDRLDQIIIGLKSGAAGVLKQTSSGRDLRAAVHAIASGFVWCDKGIFESVTEYLLPVKQLREPRLTVREKEVLHCIGQGQTNKEIASRLHLSEQTVKVYVSALLRKAGVPSRGGLALLTAARGAEAT